MIVVNLIALAVVVYRMATRRFTRVEGVLLAIIVVNWMMVVAQINVGGHKLLPEKRYWAQVMVLALGWFAWGVRQASAGLAQKFAPAKFLLPLAVALLAANDLVILVKPHLPVGRRHAYVQACDWAEARIRADWDGPARDATNVFHIANYHLPNRPCIDAHSNRLPYVLGGRADSLVKQSAVDIPDYIFDEEREIDLRDRYLRGTTYRLLDRVKFGKRTFALYRRETGGGQ